MRQQFISTFIVLSQILYGENPKTVPNILCLWQQNLSVPWLAIKFTKAIWGSSSCLNWLLSVHKSDLCCLRYCIVRIQQFEEMFYFTGNKTEVCNDLLPNLQKPYEVAGSAQIHCFQYIHQIFTVQDNDKNMYWPLVFFYIILSEMINTTLWNIITQLFIVNIERN